MCCSSVGSFSNSVLEHNVVYACNKIVRDVLFSETYLILEAFKKLEPLT